MQNVRQNEVECEVGRKEKNGVVQSEYKDRKSVKELQTNMGIVEVDGKMKDKMKWQDRVKRGGNRDCRRRRDEGKKSMDETSWEKRHRGA